MNPFETLLTSSSGRRVGAETLEMLGRKAAQMFVEKGIPLNDAVHQLVSEDNSLNNEHVRRVVEFANTVAFQELFSKSSDKNVHFPVADPGTVLRDLKDGGSPAHDGNPLGSTKDFQNAPTMEKKDDFDDSLEQMFQYENHDGIHAQGDASGSAVGAEKTASASGYELQHANPIDDVYDVHTKLQASRRELLSAHETWDLMEKQAQEELFLAVKREVLDPYGAGLGGVVSALQKVASDDFTVSKALSPVVQRLVSESHINNEKLASQLEKTAGIVVNPEHAIVRAFTGLAKVAHNKQATAIAVQEIEAGLRQTKAFLQGHTR